MSPDPNEPSFAERDPVTEDATKRAEEKLRAAMATLRNTEAQVSAMPERSARSVNDPKTFNVIVDIEGERFVPEQRALDAESRLREVEAEREKFREQISNLVDDINGFYPRNQAILEESRALRADREALVPLARWGLEWSFENDIGMGCPTAAQREAARAILAREAGE